MTKHLLLVFLLAAPLSTAWPRAGGGGGGGFGGGGGCFPAGTAIATIEGGRPIEEIAVGDKVLAFADDNIVRTAVENVYKKKDRLMVIRTNKGRLTATSEHPLLTPDGFREVRKLKKGMEVAVLIEGRRRWARISSIKPGGVAIVYNLEVGTPHTFIADGFIVHNKGGGFSGGFSGGYGGYNYYGYYGNNYYYGGRRHYLDYFSLAILLTFFLIKGISMFTENAITGGGKKPASNRILDNSVVAPRAAATLAIMKSLSRRDSDFDPRQLDGLVRTVFTRVQLAWQARDYSTVGDIMMPNILAGHTAKIDSMKRLGEVNMLDDLKILGVDFVHVRCPREKEGRSFTALIKASARDYTISALADPLAPPPQVEPSVFEEFWTFYQLNGKWALGRIDQAGELEIFNAPNLPDSPQSAADLPKAAAIAAGAGAYIPGALPVAAARRTAAPAPNDYWDRQKMEIAATLAFENVYGAWGKNDSSQLNKEFVSAEALARLKRIMDERKTEGLDFEFRSLFARRAEIVLASPAAKNDLHLDEFTARIMATALRSMLRNGKVLHSDAAPEPFTEYWVFGRQDENWKLLDILPRMGQGGADNTNDGAPSPVQIEWYWQPA